MIAISAIRRDAAFLSAILFAGMSLVMGRSEILCERGDAAGIKKLELPATTEEGDKGWFVIKSRNFDIYCARDTDLKTISNRLEKLSLFARGVYDPNPVSSPAQKIAYRMDMILKRVERTLDMHPEMGRISIKIAIRGIKPLSSYSHRGRTIYVSQDVISDAMMAREMARAVIDNYFAVTPPEKVREILAGYTALHLEG